MSLIRVENVTMKYGDRLVLRDVYFRLKAGDRVGLIGKNGSGKTTLLRLILEREAPTEGRVEITRGVRVGYFSQFSELDGELSVQQVLEEVFAEIRAVEADLEQVGLALEGDLSEDGLMETLLERQSALFEEMERRDGWNYGVRINTVLTKLGFSEDLRHRPLNKLSGGWRNRANLAKILLEEPDVLLLDEPTNYLDIEGVAWLEGWLKNLRGAFLLVSHDRQFLDQVVTRLIETENYHLQEYEGGYTQYVREKPFRIKNLERQFQHEEELLVTESEAIDERRQAAKNPDPAMQRKLADLKKRREPRPVESIVTRVYEQLQVREKLCRAEDLAKGYGGSFLFQNLSFELERGERLAIVGPNGCGKSTLLRIIIGEETPDLGTFAWEGGTQFASFNEMLARLPLKDTISHAVNVSGMALNAPRKQVHHFLSLLRFSEIDLGQRIGELSGGQQARVALAQCLLSGAAVLVLDEPTNHLDVTSIQVMEQALLYFPGAVIVVSHDRFFIDKVATRLLVFREQSPVRDVRGNWTTWQSLCP